MYTNNFVPDQYLWTQFVARASITSTGCLISGINVDLKVMRALHTGMAENNLFYSETQKEQIDDLAAEGKGILSLFSRNSKGAVVVLNEETTFVDSPAHSDRQSQQEIGSGSWSKLIFEILVPVTRFRDGNVPYQATQHIMVQPYNPEFGTVIDFAAKVYGMHDSDQGCKGAVYFNLKAWIILSLQKADFRDGDEGRYIELEDKFIELEGLVQLLWVHDWNAKTWVLGVQVAPDKQKTGLTQRFLWSLFTGHPGGGYGILHLAGYDSLVTAGNNPRIDLPMRQRFPFTTMFGVILTGDNQRDDMMYPGFPPGVLIGCLMLAGLPRDNVRRVGLRFPDSKAVLPSVQILFESMPAKTRFLENYGAMTAWTFIRREGGFMTTFSTTSHLVAPVQSRQPTPYTGVPDQEGRIQTTMDRAFWPHTNMESVQLEHFFRYVTVATTQPHRSNGSATTTISPLLMAVQTPSATPRRGIFTNKAVRPGRKVPNLQDMGRRPDEPAESIEGDIMMPHTERMAHRVMHRDGAFQTLAYSQSSSSRHTSDDLETTLSDLVHRMAAFDLYRTMEVMRHIMDGLHSRVNERAIQRTSDNGSEVRTGKRQHTRTTPTALPDDTNITIADMNITPSLAVGAPLHATDRRFQSIDANHGGDQQGIADDASDGHSGSDMEIVTFMEVDGRSTTTNQEVDPLETGWTGEMESVGGDDNNGKMSPAHHNEDEHGNGSGGDLA